MKQIYGGESRLGSKQKNAWSVAWSLGIYKALWDNDFMQNKRKKIIGKYIFTLESEGLLLGVGVGVCNHTSTVNPTILFLNELDFVPLFVYFENHENESRNIRKNYIGKSSFGS